MLLFFLKCHEYYRWKLIRLYTRRKICLVFHKSINVIKSCKTNNTTWNYSNTTKKKKLKHITYTFFIQSQYVCD